MGSTAIEGSTSELTYTVPPPMPQVAGKGERPDTAPEAGGAGGVGVLPLPLPPPPPEQAHSNRSANATTRMAAMLGAARMSRVTESSAAKYTLPHTTTGGTHGTRRARQEHDRLAEDGVGQDRRRNHADATAHRRLRAAARRRRG